MSTRYPIEITEAARRVWLWLAHRDPSPTEPVDAVIGFGLFDLRIARHCAELHRTGRARRIIFTGGVGAGSGNLTQPEADAFWAEARRVNPALSTRDVVIENRSTHTGENVAFTRARLEKEDLGLRPGTGLRRAIIVAGPSRLRRAALTFAMGMPEVACFRDAPETDWEQEVALYASVDIDLVLHVMGEVDRIQRYPAHGWIRAEPVPDEILGDVVRIKRY